MKESNNNLFMESDDAADGRVWVVSWSEHSVAVSLGKSLHLPRMNVMREWVVLGLMVQTGSHTVVACKWESMSNAKDCSSKMSGITFRLVLWVERQSLLNEMLWRDNLYRVKLKQSKQGPSKLNERNFWNYSDETIKGWIDGLKWFYISKLTLSKGSCKIPQIE